MESTGRDPEELAATSNESAAEDSGQVTDERSGHEVAGSSAAAAVAGETESKADALDIADDGNEDAAEPASDDALVADDALISDDALVAEDALIPDDALIADGAPLRPRRAPRYGVFIGVGVVAGIILALILYFALPSDGSSNSLTGLVYLAILVTPLTALLAALAAVLFERRSLRK